MASLFTKIIKGEIPSYKVAENDKFFAFLDIYPLQRGHTLVVPKTEVDYIFDLDDSLLAEMILFAKRVALGIEKEVDCERIGLAVIGLEVSHAHIHLIPIENIDDMSFSKPKKKFTDEEFQETARLIADAIQL